MNITSSVFLFSTNHLLCASDQLASSSKLIEEGVTFCNVSVWFRLCLIADSLYVRHFIALHKPFCLIRFLPQSNTENHMCECDVSTWRLLHPKRTVSANVEVQNLTAVIQPEMILHQRKLSTTNIIRPEIRSLIRFAKSRPAALSKPYINPQVLLPLFIDSLQNAGLNLKHRQEYRESTGDTHIHTCTHSRAVPGGETVRAWRSKGQ